MIEFILRRFEVRMQRRCPLFFDLGSHLLFKFRKNKQNQICSITTPSVSQPPAHRPIFLDLSTTISFFSTNSQEGFVLQYQQGLIIIMLKIITHIKWFKFFSKAIPKSTEKQTATVPFFTSARTTTPSFIKKVEEQEKEEPDRKQILQGKLDHNIEKLTDILTQNKITPQQLFKLKEQIFEQNPSLIALYLSRITPLLTPAFYNTFKPQLTYLNQSLNNYSQELTLTSTECLTMLQYRVKCRQVDPLYSPIHNFGFQRKATLVCSSFIHKRQVEMSQAIFIMRSLLGLGSMSYIIFINFLKYLKNVIEQTPEKVKLEHIVGILETAFFKRNQITIENILADFTLNYLLQHMGQLMQGQNLSMKVTVVKILILANFKYFYKSDNLTRELWTKHLLSQISRQISQLWVKQLLYISIPSHNQLNYKHVLTLLDTINFAVQNKREHQCFYGQFQEILGKVFSTLIDGLNEFIEVKDGLKKIDKQMNEIGEEQSTVLVRLIFNPVLSQKWLQKPKYCKIVEKILMATSLKKESAFYPIIDLLNSHQHKAQRQPTQEQTKNIDTLIDIVTKVFKHYKKQHKFIIWSFVAKMTQILPPKKGLDIIKNLFQIQNSDHSVQEPVLSYILLIDYYTHKNNIDNFTVPKTLIDIFQQKIQKPTELISKLHKTIKNFRNIPFSLNCLSILLNTAPALTDHLKKLKLKRQLQQDIYQLLELILINFTNEREKHQPLLVEVLQHLLKDNVMKHQYLSNCFSQQYPNNKQYHVRSHIFSNPNTFKQNFQFIYRNMQSDKLSFFLWDVFIKNYSKLSLQLRQECYQLMQTVFLKAYEEQLPRKMILLTVLANHIGSNLIVGPRQRLSQLLQLCLDKIIESADVVNVQYHYQCYLQIVINALSAGILSFHYFSKIIKYSQQMSKGLKHTCTLMLLYGAVTMQEKDNLMSPEEISRSLNQIGYLRTLVGKFQNKTISIRGRNIKEQQNKKRNISGKIISIYFGFNLTELAKMQSQVITYLRSSNDYTSTVLMINFLNKKIYKTSKEQKFISKVSQLLVEKVNLFVQLRIISQSRSMELKRKIQE